MLFSAIQNILPKNTCYIVFQYPPQSILKDLSSIFDEKTILGYSFRNIFNDRLQQSQNKNIQNLKTNLYKKKIPTRTKYQMRLMCLCVCVCVCVSKRIF